MRPDSTAARIEHMGVHSGSVFASASLLFIEDSARIPVTDKTVRDGDGEPENETSKQAKPFERPQY